MTSNEAWLCGDFSEDEQPAWQSGSQHFKEQRRNTTVKMHKPDVIQRQVAAETSTKRLIKFRLLRDDV